MEQSTIFYLAVGYIIIVMLIFHAISCNEQAICFMLVVGACHKGPSLPHHLLTDFTPLLVCFI